MAWRVRIDDKVVEAVNGLASSGALPRAGLLRVYNSLRLLLPQHARRFQSGRYLHDLDYFLYRVGFLAGGDWHAFTFYVNDSIEPGLLVVEDMEHEPPP